MENQNKKPKIDWSNGKCQIDGDISLLHDITRGQRMKWHDVNEEKPNENDDFITLINTESRHIIEIAPWRNGSYQGSYCMMCYTGTATVTHWMPLPKLPKGGEQ